jgi:hypothetical protein
VTAVPGWFDPFRDADPILGPYSFTGAIFRAENAGHRRIFEEITDAAFVSSARPS